MSKCEKCGIKEATQFVVEVSMEGKTEYYLCDDCAYLIIHALHDVERQKNSLEAFTGAIFLQKEVSRDFTKEELETQCRACGYTFYDFLKIRKFKCDDCYDSFRHLLPPVFQALHGSDLYRGSPHEEYSELREMIIRKIQILGRIDNLLLEEKYEEITKLKRELDEINQKILNLT